ncbi:UDP-glucose/GDP-mannose dehydrogenase family protein [Devosia sp. MC521]|uniref:UDP-glucose dehydrogenase family protein n=1 Tax=Devosia sp. MC521 TaxID=2759954 RepID=UPI0015FDA33F|nr:UDP-glucose/GDP-mannose dehydrogenase family protein [Devosia sp. MC521]MBJ6989237.1 UDP-glucose/GDP-mannose dehydrogenase family protein [Devosia sp. MC521]QMW63334.1 UDP-glucose/GDP-mannose dehydrogenase family protein [Devosia sp. MC521]
MQIAIIGSGYVGLVSGACFADFGHDVSCVDLDEKKIEALKKGQIPIFEPGLEDLVDQNAKSGRLTFTTNLAPAVAKADVVFLAVGTPSRRGDGHADLSYVYAAAADIARALKDFTVVVTKSTVPVGTGDEVERIIQEANPDADVVVVSNPEFLREGAAIEDFKRPDRIVVGLDDERAREVMMEIYRPLYLNQAPLMFTGRRTAELIKYAGNAFLAMKITFINEIADLCERTGANVQDVARGIGLDNRIGSKFLNAGPGYGGSCFPKDTLALVKTGQDYDAPLRLVEATVEVNDRRKRAMGRKIIAAAGGSVRGKTIGILGLTFKPNTDDMRDAPSIAIIQTLQDAGAKIRAYDPEGTAMAKTLLADIDYAADAYDTADGVDALVLVTEWNAFRGLDLQRLRNAMSDRVFVDLRNVYRRKEVEAAGLDYTSIGRPHPLSD